MRPNQTIQIAVVQPPSVLRTSLALTLDVLETANRIAMAGGRPAPFAVILLSTGDALPRGTAALILPGTGASSWEELSESLASEQGQATVALLQTAARRGVLVATSCSGVGFAAASGVLDGKRCTTSWFLASALRRSFPAVTVLADCLVVEADGVITAGAALAHADLMLHLVERLSGTGLADLCARYLLLDRRASQRPYLLLGAMLAGEPRLASAEAFVRANLAERFTIRALAAAVGMGERSFARLVDETCGCSPIRLVQRIRVNAASAMMQEGLSLDAIAPRVGYADATALRRVMRQVRGAAPRRR